MNGGINKRTVYANLYFRSKIEICLSNASHRIFHVISHIVCIFYISVSLDFLQKHKSLDREYRDIKLNSNICGPD